MPGSSSTPTPGTAASSSTTTSSSPRSWRSSAQSEDELAGGGEVGQRGHREPVGFDEEAGLLRPFLAPCPCQSNDLSSHPSGALGLAILATVANTRTDDAVAAGKAAAVALTEGFQTAFLVAAVIAMAGAILATVLVSSRASREHAQAAQRGQLHPIPAAI